MKVLLIGSGGREHVLAWKIKQSPLVKKIYCAPGNGGIDQIAEPVDIEATDIDALLKWAVKNKIDLTVVGPEAPLVAGIVDQFQNEGLKIFGPSKTAALLEGSKVFAKSFMHECNIPTAAFRIFKHSQDAKNFLGKARFPLVIKADGLAAGKGVMICKDLDDALQAVDEIMEQKVFKEAGNQILVEECLEGEEVSILAISDGENYVLLEPSQDHKRIFDDDVGPNTGGMGAYCPTQFADKDLMKQIETRIIEPTIRGMKRGGMPFKGVLYAGLMITQDGPMTLEYNVRFGDPEIQAVLPRLKNDIVEVMLASIDGELNKVELEWEDKPCVCVVMSSGGYPGEYKTGLEISGLDAKFEKDIMVFHAGTKKDGKKIVTAGGRVLGIVGLGKNVNDAIERTYAAVEKITFDRCFFRRDIGAKALMPHKNKARVISSTR